MKAVRIGRFGGPDVLEVVDLPTPVPGPSEVLVRVRAVGVNFADTLMRENRYALTPPLPCVLGSEVAGVVERVGPDVVGLAVGARVAVPLFVAGIAFGGYAEYVAIDANYAVGLPDDVSFEQAVALMVQGLTALHLLRRAPVDGKIVLVNAAAGGVGSFLVQLARRAGATTIVAAASTPEKRAFARTLGADLAIDYTRADWAESLRDALGGVGPDVIYESVGGDVMKRSLDVLAPLGQIVVYGALNIQDFQLGVPELLGLVFKNQSLTGFAVAPLLTPAALREGLAELFDLAARGALKVTIGGRHAIEDAADAHRALESRGTMGKVVLIP